MTKIANMNLPPKLRDILAILIREFVLCHLTDGIINVLDLIILVNEILDD